MTTTDRPPPDDGLGVPISEVSRRLGVPMPTLRSWEARYKLLDSDRGSGRHRRYTPIELHGLRLMRDEIARGKRASLAAASVRELLDRSGQAQVFVREVLDASERSDPAAVREGLYRAQATLGIGRCLDEVLLPSMTQIGLWWQSGRCDIAQEQLTTETVRAWLEALLPLAPPPERPNPVVLACGPTDFHTIGLESLGILLRYRGNSCRLLGARTALPAVAAAVHATRADTVVIVSHLSSGRARAVQSLRAAVDLDVNVFYAGNAFYSERSRRNVPGHYLGTNLEHACDLIEDARA